MCIASSAFPCSREDCASASASDTGGGCACGEARFCCAPGVSVEHNSSNAPTPRANRLKAPHFVTAAAPSWLHHFASQFFNEHDALRKTTGGYCVNLIAGN